MKAKIIFAGLHEGQWVLMLELLEEVWVVPTDETTAKLFKEMLLETGD